jgi:serine kinase of HPr protein (carbohydrate metabolism regulator)
MSALSSEQLHASAIAVGGRGVLLSGPSGAGKSDLALRLIDRGAQLISDDVTLVRRVDGSLRASPPERIKGKLEVRSLGIFDLDYIEDAPVALLVDLVERPPRFPLETQSRTIAGVALPVVELFAFEASAPIKVEMALKRISG